MTSAILKFNQHFPPAQARTIRLALEQGLVSDKAQARIEGLQPDSIGSRWDAIANRLHLKYGQRDRAQVVIALVRSRAVEFLMLVICTATAVMPGIDMLRPARPARPTRTTSTPARKRDGDALIDLHELIWRNA